MAYGFQKHLKTKTFKKLYVFPPLTVISSVHSLNKNIIPNLVFASLLSPSPSLGSFLHQVSQDVGFWWDLEDQPLQWFSTSFAILNETSSKQVLQRPIHETNNGKLLSFKGVRDPDPASCLFAHPRSSPYTVLHSACQSRTRGACRRLRLMPSEERPPLIHWIRVSGGALGIFIIQNSSAKPPIHKTWEALPSSPEA